MPRRLLPAEPDLVDPALDRALPLLDAGVHPERADLRLLARHYLARLAEAAPGRSVEVRVPPYAAIQCVGGPRHTRGTPPAVVETDGPTWVRLATGRLAWADALADGRLTATGERTDLSGYLPLERDRPPLA